VLKGVPVVETHWMPPGDASEWEFDGDVVVKPAVLAGSMDAERYTFSRRAEALAHVRRLHAAGRVVMVQPFIPSVEKRGRRIWCSGR